jgi:hypothetical protein
VIRRLRFLGAAPRSERDRTEAEAQRLARKAAVEALQQRIEEQQRALVAARAEIIRLTARLRVAEHVRHAPDWMHGPARAARNLDPDVTVVVPSSLIRRPAKGRHR